MKKGLPLSGNNQFLKWQSAAFKGMISLICLFTFLSVSSFAQDLTVGNCGTVVTSNDVENDNLRSQLTSYPTSNCQGTFDIGAGPVNGGCVKYELNGPAGAVVTLSAGLGTSCNGANANVFDEDKNHIPGWRASGEGAIEDYTVQLPTEIWICGRGEGVDGIVNVCIDDIQLCELTPDDCDPCERLNDNCECEPITPPVCNPCERLNDDCECEPITPPVCDPCERLNDDCECEPITPPVCDPCEILNDDCECVDDPSTKPGKPCDDGDPCTKHDKYDENCYCVGTPIGEPGDECDDGNPCTINDVLDENCKCKGTSIGDNTDTDKDGIPDCLDDCPYMLDDFVYADLECGKTVYNNNIRGRSMFEEYGECTMPECPATGRELIYRITNHKPSDLIITFIEDEHPQLKKLNLFVINDPCEPGCIGVLHAPRANGEGDQLVIPDAPAGVYYIIIDGNKPYAVNNFSLRVDCVGGGPATCPPNAHYYEDFEGYRVGKPITSQDPIHWKTFGAGSRSPMISNDRASNGYLSLEFNRIEGGIQDVKLDLGKKFKGVWKICWNMYIERMNTAFFGLFGGDYSDPWGTVNYRFGMMDMDFQGKWFDVELFVDLDANKYILFLDNRQYSKHGDYYLNLDFINFYGPPGAHFYVDRICYSETSSIPEPAEDRLQDAFYTDEELRDKLSAQEVSVFPNPAAEEVYVDLRKYAGQAVNIKIFNSMSTEVFNRDIPEVTTDRARISLKGFTNGLHILNVQSKGTPSVAKKLVISRMY